MRLCGRCKAAENPLAQITFVDSPEGPLCGKCYEAHYTSPPPSGPPGGVGELVVITCPDCRGKHHGTHGNKCEACCGYGSVRIPANALAVYRPRRPEEPEKPQVLTED